MWSYQEYCDEVEVESGRFAAVAARADPGVRVPTCPEWTVAELIDHHGRSQRRVAQVVRTLARQPVWSKDVDAGLPGDPADYAAWFAQGVPALLTALRGADPDAPVWTNGVDGHVRYWARRILYEAVVHRVDAELALGERPIIDPAAGVDGIDELLTNLQCFPWVAERLRELEDPGGTVRLSAVDRDSEWLIVLAGGGFRFRRGSVLEAAATGVPADVEVRGTAGGLLLLVYGRLAPDDPRFIVYGDAPLLARWLTSCAF
ncbi:MAG: maleylpyruvate isomerase family mycothiol-dependent enzyme [Micromonosporaceae bacterium]